MRLIGLIIFCIFGHSAAASDNADITAFDKLEMLKAKVRLHDGDWEPNYPKLDESDSMFINSQDREITDWENLKEDEFLSFKYWSRQQAVKDVMPDWKEIVRNRRNKEVVARVLKCIGVCSSFRGSAAAPSSYQTVLREGDEFFTDENSFAWLVLVDGSIARVSPRTSLTLTEVNIGVKNNLILIRLNEGHVYIEARVKGDFKTLNLPESDTGLYPVLVKEANREYYSIKEYNALNEEYKIIYKIKENPGHQTQYKKLNELLNETSVTRDSIIFLYSPNVTLISKNASVSLFYSMNGKSYFNASTNIRNMDKTDQRDQSIHYYLRGYTNKTEHEVEEDSWYSVDQKGSSARIISKPPPVLHSISAFTNRIPTIQLAREVFIRKYTQFNIYEEQISKNTLGINYQYRLWDQGEKEEISQRIEYLKEYTRRIETTNLKNIAKLFKEPDGSHINYHYIATAMNRHFEYLKKLYSEKRKYLLEMNSTQYYLWLLRYGKNKI